MKALFVAIALALLPSMCLPQIAAIHCDGDPVVSAESPLSSPIELLTQEGKPARLSEFRGTPLIINFWATWCPPCRRELPWFAAIQSKYGSKGLRVVGISMDEKDDPAVRELASQAGVNYTLLFGSLESSLELIGAQGLPITLYLDRSGKILHKSVGIANQQELERNAQEILR